MRKHKHLSAGFVTGALVAGLVAGGVAVAQSGGGTEYTGCIGIYGILFQVAEGSEPEADCGAGTEVTWNQEGPEGPPGPQGPSGPSADGRVIPVVAGFVHPGGGWQDHPAVDVSDCQSVRAYVETNGGGPVTLRSSPTLAGVATTFGPFFLDLVATNDTNTGYTFSGGAGPGHLAEEMVVGTTGPAGQVQSVWLFCVPRT